MGNEILSQTGLREGFESRKLSINPDDPSNSINDLATRFDVSYETALYTVGYGYQWGWLSPVRSPHYPGAGFEQVAVNPGSRILRFGLPSEFAFYMDNEAFGNRQGSYSAYDINPLSIARSQHYIGQRGISDSEALLHNLACPLEGQDQTADLIVSEFLFEGMEHQTARSIMNTAHQALKDDGAFVVKFVAVSDEEAVRTHDGMRAKAELWKRPVKEDLPFDWANIASAERSEARSLGIAYADHVYAMNYTRQPGLVTFRNLADFLHFATMNNFAVESQHKIIQTSQESVGLVTADDTSSEGVFMVRLVKKPEADMSEAIERANLRRERMLNRRR
ncbi:MAG: hypothetical protein TR69_WS6001000697 [candidate division WS6 bacterium OLB20]|uniref:Uncharacterized protein n=1 Tax=candidate division WS6 bacterium OLB20 TaxID=1617426 RepID=A0A136LYG7_9BACT|nr:MAG: hypothetical protein TR69_WS6001000697 [candidate division WS6 bacterium OLB20]